MSIIRDEAYRTIVRVLKDNDFSDTLLQQSVKKIQKANENPSLYYQIVKGVIKMHGNLEYICSLLTDADKYSKTDMKIKVMLYLGLYQLIFLKQMPDHAAVNETVELAKSVLGDKPADFVNAILRNYLRMDELHYPEEVAAQIAAEHSYPIDLVNTWLQLWGQETTEYLCMHFNEVPKLHLRVNSLATSKKRLLDYFSRRNIELSDTSASPSILITTQAQEVLQDVAFSEGYFTVQDAAAAMVVDLLDPQPEESIIDFFAAPGGKATYIAEKMNNTGEVIAIDKIPNKVKLIKQNLERLQIENVQLITQDAFKYGPVAPAYDRVLLDVPCSGWGVFGRKAELRWQKHQDLKELTKIQSNALSLGASFVKVGGYLVYSTCTMNPAENELQIEKFLKQNSSFLLVPAHEFIPTEYTKNGYLYTVPYQHFVDGAFAAKLVRTK